MKMGRAGTIAGAAMLGLTLLASAEEPQPAARGGAGREGWQERRGARLAEYLGLDAQQKAALMQLQQQHREETKPLWQEGQDLRRRLREATEAEKPDPLAVGEATLALKVHHERMKAGRAAFEQRIVALLTPEQKQRYEAFKAARQFDRGRRDRGGRFGTAGRKGES